MGLQQDKRAKSRRMQPAPDNAGEPTSQSPYCRCWATWTVSSLPCATTVSRWSGTTNDCVGCARISGRTASTCPIRRTGDTANFCATDIPALVVQRQHCQTHACSNCLHVPYRCKPSNPSTDRLPAQDIPSRCGLKGATPDTLEPSWSRDERVSSSGSHRSF